MNIVKKRQAMKEFDKIAMEQAIEESKINLKSNLKNGGPFGAAIV